MEKIEIHFLSLKLIPTKSMKQLFGSTTYLARRHERIYFHFQHKRFVRSYIEKLILILFHLRSRTKERIWLEISSWLVLLEVCFYSWGRGKCFLMYNQDEGADIVQHFYFYTRATPQKNKLFQRIPFQQFIEIQRWWNLLCF